MEKKRELKRCGTYYTAQELIELQRKSGGWGAKGGPLHAYYLPEHGCIALSKGAAVKITGKSDCWLGRHPYMTIDLDDCPIDECAAIEATWEGLKE